VADPRQFRSGREFAARLGLTPLQNSSGGKERLGHISKMGNRNLRTLLVVGATALVRHARHKPDRADLRLLALLARKPVRVASVAMANKMARVVWAIMARGRHTSPVMCRRWRDEPESMSRRASEIEPE
jgi:transposase